MTQTSVRENLLRIQERIAQAANRAGRGAEEITLIGVSKTQPASAIREAYEAGVRHFGENRVQEWEGKRVDDFAIAQRLDRARAEEGITGKLRVLIEVRVAPEETKSGVEIDELPKLAESFGDLPRLELGGLMCIPPFLEKAEQVRPHFKRLRELRDELEKKLGLGLSVLSMGMSHDFEVAIEEGATEVRVGTALFGIRDIK